MKKYIIKILAFITIALSPQLGAGQCVLFLQAPDTICAERKDLVIKTSKISGNDVKYQWKRPNMPDTITTDSVLRIAAPSVKHSGNYSVRTLSNTCDTTFFGPINVQVVGSPKTSLDTVKIVPVCGGSETKITSENKTNAHITGEWSGTEGLIFSNPKLPSTDVKGLKIGDNFAFWRLSSRACPNFLIDTFIIRREIAPIIETDIIELRAGEASKTIHLGNVNGSNINLIKDVAIIITKHPKDGDLKVLDDGKRLKFTRGKSLSVNDGFKIKVCNLRCSTLCSPEIAYGITINIDERYPNVTISKVLAPNDNGDARFFRIENAKEYPTNELTIMNRWGDKVIGFKSYTETTNWNGFSEKGVQLAAGAYYYLFQANDKDGKPLKPLTGIFFIINQ